MDSRVKQAVSRWLNKYRRSEGGLIALKDIYFRPGVEVRLDSHRYRGVGIVDVGNQCPPDMIAVRIPNGNVWWYRLDECDPVVDASRCVEGQTI